LRCGDVLSVIAVDVAPTAGSSLDPIAKLPYDVAGCLS
jgi:hypothetical protein